MLPNSPSFQKILSKLKSISLSWVHFYNKKLPILISLKIMIFSEKKNISAISKIWKSKCILHNIKDHKKQRCLFEWVWLYNVYDCLIRLLNFTACTNLHSNKVTFEQSNFLYACITKLEVLGQKLMFKICLFTKFQF